MARVTSTVAVAARGDRSGDNESHSGANESTNGGSTMARNDDGVRMLLPLLPYELVSPSPLFAVHDGDTGDGFGGNALVARRGGNISLWLCLNSSLSLSAIATFFLSFPLIHFCVCVSCVCVWGG
ncbi:uncharacterized protein LOC110272269 [Arachis ipaensis]|uniref:uncharacterized protein LOC110272269 n=1 Tax=Arachis ipaensis TaxID=130454 RepID=UPI000A2B957D|nr:uncharacterized protein LOC110272269 [Arachis ipaensis]